MIKTTRWSPDTCKCILEFQWDTDKSLSKRTHTFLPPTEICPLHSSVHISEISDVVYEENLRKNWSLDIVHSRVSSLTLEDILWNYTEERVLILELSGLVSKNNRDFIQDAVDTQFGPGKVMIL